MPCMGWFSWDMMWLTSAWKKFAAPHFHTARHPGPHFDLWSVILTPYSAIAHMQMMTETRGKQVAPTPEKVLRDLAKNASKAIPRFEEKEPIIGVK